jgi:hypothetical protein
VHLVGFIVRICHDARSSECQIRTAFILCRYWPINHGLYFVIQAKAEGTVSDLNTRIGKDKLQVPLLTVHYTGVYETLLITNCKSNSKTPRNLGVLCVKRGKAHKNIHIYLRVCGQQSECAIFVNTLRIFPNFRPAFS